MQGEVLEKDKARRIYEDIVRSMRDPALLEYMDRGPLPRARLPDPGARQGRDQPQLRRGARRDGGVHELRYPLKTQAFSKSVVDQISVRVSIESAAPIKSIFSSSHEIDVARKDERRAAASFEGKRAIADRDFHLFWTVDAGGVGLHLLTEKKGKDDGFFMMKLSPDIGADADAGASMPKDVVFVLDTSGSMQEDEKIEQAKKALAHGLRTLNPKDRFGIVTFATEARRYAPGAQQRRQGRRRRGHRLGERRSRGRRHEHRRGSRRGDDGPRQG